MRSLKQVTIYCRQPKSLQLHLSKPYLQLASDFLRQNLGLLDVHPAAARNCDTVSQRVLPDFRVTRPTPNTLKNYKSRRGIIPKPLTASLLRRTYSRAILPSAFSSSTNRSESQGTLYNISPCKSPFRFPVSQTLDEVLTTQVSKRLSVLIKSNPARPISRAKSSSDRFRNLSTSPNVSSELGKGLMSPEKTSELDSSSTEPAQHKPLVVGLKKPSTNASMSTTDQTKALNEQIEANVTSNTDSAAPPAADGKPAKKKEKAPKQPKPPKVAAPTAPTSPALIDLRVGHILRAIAHPNADSLYVSTIAMGDPEGTEHTEVDKETGKVVRTVCSGLRAYIPLEEMQDRKIIVVANLKPVNMRSIKSAAMVLAASPKPAEGADAHAPDRIVELVVPPTGSEAGDKVYFEGWPYGEGKGPEKQLNPKKKQWEAIQPGFYTSDDLKVGFDASACGEVEGSDKGELIVEGKGPCTVPTLKGAVVR